MTNSFTVQMQLCEELAATHIPPFNTLLVSEFLESYNSSMSSFSCDHGTSNYCRSAGRINTLILDIAKKGKSGEVIGSTKYVLSYFRLPEIKGGAEAREDGGSLTEIERVLEEGTGKLSRNLSDAVSSGFDLSYFVILADESTEDIEPQGEDVEPPKPNGPCYALLPIKVLFALLLQSLRST